MIYLPANCQKGLKTNSGKGILNPFWQQGTLADDFLVWRKSFKNTRVGAADSAIKLNKLIIVLM